MVKTQEVDELDAADNGRLEREYTRHDAPRRTPSLSQGAIIGIAAVIAAATGVIGFVGGIQFQKGTNSSSVANQGGFGNGQGGMGGGMGMRNGSFGTVTAVSDSSITITVMRGGPDSSSSSSSSSTTKTYTINSSTKITVDGSTGSVSDIATGDTVMIEADSDDSSIAASIRVGMGGMPGQGQTQSATNSTSSET